MRWAAVVMVVVILVPVGYSQTFTDPDYFEDFEDDTNGAHPTDSWYVYDDYCRDVGTGCETGQDIHQVSTNGLNGTSRSFRYRADGTEPERMQFLFNDALSVNAFEFWVEIGVDQALEVYFLCNQSPGQLGSISGADIHTALRFRSGGVGDSDNLVQEGTYASFTSTLFQEPRGGNNQIKVVGTISGSTLSYTITDTIGGSSSGSEPIAQCSPVNAVTLTRTISVSGFNSMYFDELVLNNNVPVIVADENVTGSEFDSGLVSFASSAGFISSESQFLFTLILMGLLTVTGGAASRWVSPGRFKNTMLMAIQALVGVFCVILAFLDLWMFIVAFMLGVFAIRGGSEIRNTFYEIRDALKKQNEREGPDIGPRQVMEVEIQESKEGTETASKGVGESEAPEAQESRERPERKETATPGGEESS